LGRTTKSHSASFEGGKRKIVETENENWEEFQKGKKSWGERVPRGKN